MTPGPADLFGRTLHSVLWQFLGVGGQRIVQFIAPVVLWRVLDDPRDIGLFAILLAGIGVIESLTVFVGEQTSIWSARGAERRYLDTVFTVRLLRGVLISGLLASLSWVFAWYFGRPATAARYWLPGLFLLLSGNGILDGLQSPARAAMMKGLEFRRVALGDFLSSVAGTGVTLLLAFLWRDVWALVAGYLAGTAARTIASYFVAPHRPALAFERDALAEIFHYQVGAFGTPSLLLLIISAPALVIGGILGEFAVAVYEGAAKLARLPQEIFQRVLSPVAIPAYAQLQHDIPRLGRAWTRAVGAFLIAGTPLTVTLAWCGDALPRVVWGDRYIASPGLFALLSVHGGLAGLTSVIGPLFWAIGRPQWDRTAQFWRAAIVFGVGIPATLYGGILGFAAAMIPAIFAALGLSLFRALRHLGLRPAVLAPPARTGFGAGIVLLAALLGLDQLAAPDGWWRMAAAALLSGPLLGWLTLRELQRDRQAPPPPDAP